MPEMRFHVVWPDGTQRACYSPSLVIREFLTVGTSYPLAEFVARSREALGIASERVRVKYGFPCSLAAAELRGIETAAARFAETPAAQVLVERFE